MSAQVPVVRPINWISTAFHFLLIFGVCYFSQLRFGTMMPGITVYLLYSVLSRFLIAREHKAGMRLVRRRLYAEALPHFQKSLEFFSKYRWIDKYRSIVLLSASNMTYREMAMVNIAFCHSQMGDGNTSTEWYRRTLNEYPNNGIAIAALNMMESVKK